MKKAKLTGAVAPVPCPRCGANEWQCHRSYTSTPKIVITTPKMEGSPDVPITIMTCMKCKLIFGWTFNLKYSYSNGRFVITTGWEMLALSAKPSKKEKKSLK